MSKYYLRIEGVNLNNFVFETKDLSTIRGGGLVLLNSVKDVQDKFHLRPISTGASSGLFEVEATDDEGIEILMAKVRAFLSEDEKYKHATFVFEAIAAGAEANFAHDKETLIAHNRWQQLRSPFIAIPLTNFDESVGPCTEDRVRPAKEPGKDKVSTSVVTRQKYGRAQKQLFYEQQIRRPLVTNPNQPRSFTNDLAELATFGSEERGRINPNLNGKMAVIYIDGNKFGTIQTDRCKIAEAQIEFDKTLQATRTQLLSDFVDYMEGSKFWLAEGNRYRIETLLWGGDEIIWVVPAWQGLRTLEFFYQQAQEKNWHFQDVSFTHSAGIVFCNHKAPIHRVRKLAEELANSVKDQTEPNGNYFAYETLESFDHIGRDMEVYRLERVPASLRSDNGTKSLILNGNVVFKIGKPSIIDIVSGLKDELPRRRLSNVVKQLLEAGEQEEAQKQVNELLGEMSGKRAELKQLFERLSDVPKGNDDDHVLQPIMWMHMNALWDYLAIE